MTDIHWAELPSLPTTALDEGIGVDDLGFGSRSTCGLGGGQTPSDFTE